MIDEDVVGITAEQLQRVPELVSAVVRTREILDRTYPPLRESLAIQRRTLDLTERSLADMQREVDAYITQFKEGYFSPLALVARLAEETGELAREVNHRYGEKPKKPDEADSSIELELDHFVRAWHGVVHQLAGDELATLVVDRALRRDAARVPVGQHRPEVEDPALGGRAELRGTTWSARNVDVAALAAGQRCRVVAVQGLMLDLRSE